MSTNDSVIADFEQLLDRVPDDFTLEQWQFAYKKVIFAMGLKILELFPENAFGPPPTTSPIKGGRGPYMAGGGPTGGPIIHLASAVLGLAPPPPPLPPPPL
jgi:hypothetical protein